jgi:hypothetical protein
MDSGRILTAANRAMAAGVFSSRHFDIEEDIMSLRQRIGVLVVWLASLIAVGAWAPAPQGEPKVISGGDIGFRVDRQERGVPMGRLVVRVNGQWVEAGFAPGISRVGTK